LSLVCHRLLSLLAASLLFNKKERRRYSISRSFVGDYIGLEHKPGIRALLDRREYVEFADTVDKYDRRFKVVTLNLFTVASDLSHDFCNHHDKYTLHYLQLPNHPDCSKKIFMTGHIYTVSQKKQDTKLLPITSPNVNQFSKFFHW